jgi:hypothetical protein
MKLHPNQGWNREDDFGRIDTVFVLTSETQFIPDRARRSIGTAMLCLTVVVLSFTANIAYESQLSLLIALFEQTDGSTFAVKLRIVGVMDTQDADQAFLLAARWLLYARTIP